jgi:hypothetical protein
MVAAHIRMPRDGFERWLATPGTDTSTIANPGAMFDGWYWNGRRADDEWAETVIDGTPRELFAGRVAAACAGQPTATVLVYADGALQAYLCDLGHSPPMVNAVLAMFAAASAVKTDRTEDVALFWAEPSGRLFRPKEAGWLAVLTVDPVGARFVRRYKLTRAVAALRPAEERFLALITRMSDDEDAWDWRVDRPYRTETPRDPSFVDPSVLA